MPAGYLRGFSRLVRNYGHDPLRLLKHHYIDPSTFENPDHYIECSSVIKLLEYCREELGDPLFGLHLADLQSPDVFGCVTTLARAAPTFRLGLEKFIEYLPVVHCAQSSEIEILVARDSAEIRWHSHAGLGDNDQAVFHGFMLIKKVLASLGGPICLTHAKLTFPIARTALEPVQDIIGCRVYGKSDANAIGFSAELLDRPIETSNKLLYQLLGGYLEQMSAKHMSTLLEQTENYVRHTLPSNKCTVGGCAESLGIAARTLQKRLTRINMKFSDIIEKQRVKLAELALSESNFSLEEIAAYIGYSEQSSFGRAFKRWTGLTPQEFRTKQRAAGRPVMSAWSGQLGGQQLASRQ